MPLLEPLLFYSSTSGSTSFLSRAYNGSSGSILPHHPSNSPSAPQPGTVPVGSVLVGRATYKQLKTLALRLWCELPGHWNDFTIPDNDGPAQRQTRLGSDFLRPPSWRISRRTRPSP